MISEAYRQQLQTLHETVPTFGAGGTGTASATKILELCDQYHTNDVLDYGCGKGALAGALSFPIQQYDPGIPGHADRPKPADIVVCCDVLEHVEPEYLDAVLDDLMLLTVKAGHFAIALTPAQKHLPDGRNAHICLLPPSLWLDKLWKRFHVVSEEVDTNWLTVTVEPK